MKRSTFLGVLLWLVWPAVAAAQTGVLPADIAFMRGMIAHHAQAIEMSRLVPDRTSRPELLMLAKRIEARPASPGQEVHIEIDGELPGKLPAVYEVVPGALRVRVPNQNPK
jgi:diacylglycerol kinase family enzyme